MLNKESSQVAGENSTQYQGENITVINNGIDEKRAREIVKEMFEIAKSNFTNEAIMIAEERKNKFEDELISRIQKVEGAINSFSDPNFQVLLASANKTAIQTERSSDYEMLSELLIERTKQGNERNVSVGIKRAIDIISDVSDDALLGLTLIYFSYMFIPGSGSIEDGLSFLDSKIPQMIPSGFPTDVTWIEQLDILDAIRMKPTSTFKKYEEFLSEVLDGYVCTGIKIDSDEYKEAYAILKKMGIENLLNIHELNGDYARLYVNSKEYIRKNIFREAYKLTEQNIKEIYNIFDMYEKNDDLLKENKKKFIELLLNKENIKAIRDWNETIKECFEITIVGKVIAQANCERIDKTIPKIDYRKN